MYATWWVCAGNEPACKRCSGHSDAGLRGVKELGPESSSKKERTSLYWNARKVVKIRDCQPSQTLSGVVDSRGGRQVL